MSRIVVITAVGQDKPGIIAALAEGIFQLGANLEDTTMTRLHGAFAAMFSARLPEGTSEVDARQALSAAAQRLSLTVTVQTVADPQPVEEQPDHLITVYGADHPGIVHRVTDKLARAGINITDMDTRVAGSAAAPIYIMLLEAAAGTVDTEAEIAALRDSIGVDITVQPLQPEAL